MTQIDRTARPSRRLRRVKLDAPVMLSNDSGQTQECQCIEISEDGLDVQPLQQASLFAEFRCKAGDILKVQINQLENAPILAVAVIKASPNCIGLRIIED